MDVDFDLNLIREVKKYTMLYNANSKGYNNTEKKSRIWNAIGKRLNSNGRDCHRRWLSMRNNYKQNVQRFKRTGKDPTWIYFKILQFLDNYPPPQKKKIFQSEAEKELAECINDVDALLNNRDVMHDEDELCIQLIEEVQKHEILYNKKCVDYYDFGKRTEAWQGISEVLNKSETACKDKWRSFRDIYIKLKKKYASLTEPQDLLYNRNPQWKFYDRMQFLDNYITININNNESNKVMDCDETSRNEDGETQVESGVQNITGKTNDNVNNRSNAYPKEMKSFLDKKDNFDLIAFVKNNDILYARKWAGKANMFRNRKWEEIAKILNTSVQLCKDRWRRLRDQYIKLKKKTESDDILLDDRDPKWPYYDALTFLNDHIISKKYPVLLTVNKRHGSVSSNSSLIKTTAETSQDEAEEGEEEERETFISVYENAEEDSFTVEPTVEPIDKNDTTQFEVTVYKDGGEEEEIGDHFETQADEHQPDTDNAWNGQIEALECERVTDPNSLDFDFDEEPVLYLQSKKEDDDTNSTDSLLSEKSFCAHENKRKLLKDLRELLKKSTQPCPSCLQRQKTQTSTSLLFESLAMSIEHAQLSDDKLMSLQSEICAFIYGRLVAHKNPSSSSSPPHKMAKHT